MKSISQFYLIFLVILVFTSCEKEDPEIPHQEELITTVKFALVPDGGGSPAEFIYRDLDGDGGNAPSITNANLDAQTTYSGTITLLNETETPAEDITEEVKNEALEHQIFFSSTANVTVEYDDTDSNGNPLGLQTKLISGDAGSGTLTIVLRHEPDKSAAGVSAGDITNAGGETDVEVQFDVTIQ